MNQIHKLLFWSPGVEWSENRLLILLSNPRIWSVMAFLLPTQLPCGAGSQCSHNSSLSTLHIALFTLWLWSTRGSANKSVDSLCAVELGPRFALFMAMMPSLSLAAWSMDQKRSLWCVSVQIMPAVMYASRQTQCFEEACDEEVVFQCKTEPVVMWMFLAACTYCTLNSSVLRNNLDYHPSAFLITHIQ